MSTFDGSLPQLYHPEQQTSAKRTRWPRLCPLTRVSLNPSTEAASERNAGTIRRFLLFIAMERSFAAVNSSLVAESTVRELPRKDPLRAWLVRWAVLEIVVFLRTSVVLAH